MRRCMMDDLAKLMALSFHTFTAAFGHLNKPRDVAAYCAKAYGEDSLRRQLDNPQSSFWFLYADDELAGYMKLNTGGAQTETTEADALEIERIYVTSAFQGRGLGGYMIEQADRMGVRYGQGMRMAGRLGA